MKISDIEKVRDLIGRYQCAAEKLKAVQKAQELDVGVYVSEDANSRIMQFRLLSIDKDIEKVRKILYDRIKRDLLRIRGELLDYGVEIEIEEGNSEE